ncbi:MAG: hypothetical protein IPN87_19385 [Saprospiraceae bacterium]|nr:hypothetical protein [Candidatus Brachybacter algidus]
MILPTLCQKVAQNERTLFSYLGSQEYFGFKDGIKRLKHVGEWVLPWEVFEYFIENQPSATTDHITHRRWAEVITATERLGDADHLEGQLLKTIGLFNIIGSQAGFKASGELLDLCFPKSVNVDQLLTNLQKNPSSTTVNSVRIPDLGRQRLRSRCCGTRNNATTGTF